MCEWFRGCPNPALVCYAFSDKWLCGYCIGYARIRIPLCAEDGWRRGTCVDIESQDWFCDTHGHRCDAIVERPASRSTGNSHRCMRIGTTYQRDRYDRYYCVEHIPDNQPAHATEPATNVHLLPWASIGAPIISQTPLSTPHSSSILPRIIISPPTSRPSYQPRPVSSSHRQGLRPAQSQDRHAASAPASRSAVPRVVSQPSYDTPHVSTQPRSLVARIASAISSLSSVLLSPDGDIPPYLTDVFSALQDTPVTVAEVPQPTTHVNLNIFSIIVDTECCICLEPQRSMRRLIACNHMFCKECLSKQVNGPYARAHDCPLCRKDMFDLRGTDWETY